MKISLDRFPGGKTKALTLSYDDGRTSDRQMVALLNRYGLKATFHLNSGTLGEPGYVTKEEIRTLYEGHEIAAHTVTHPHLPHIPAERRVQEILEDRMALERLAGYPVTGMSYPYGTHSGQVAALLPQVGIAYCRTVTSSYRFDLPENLHLWQPTCHHNENLIERTQQFLALPHYGAPQLFYVWGHSFEFEDGQNWTLLEQFCQLIGQRETIWYATNRQIADYLQVMERLVFSVDGRIICNPSAQSAWISIDGVATEIPGGATWRAD